MNGWDLSITGDAIDRPVRLNDDELLDLPPHQVPAVCQCAGNRRGLSCRMSQEFNGVMGQWERRCGAVLPSATS